MSDLNFALVGKHAKQLSKAITALLVKEQPSKEMICGSMMALGNMLVVLASQVVPKDQRLDVIAAIISRAIREVDKHSNEISTDPKTPREKT